MIQRFSPQHRPGVPGCRAVAVLTLVISILLAVSTPLPAEVTSDDTPAQPLSAVELSPTAAAGDGDASSSTLTALNLGDLHGPGGLAIGQGRPKAVRTPNASMIPKGLAAAGLLFIPFDKSLEGIIPRTSAGKSSDAITENLSRLGGGTALLAIIGGMYATGSKYDKDTAKLALAALANATLVTEGLKLVTGRARPTADGGHTSFEIGGGLDKGFSSFPSGHTSAAFAVATVMANRHPKQKWLYYGLASAIGLSRIRKSEHFTSDVLVGAAIGIQSGNNAIRGGAKLFSIKF